MAELRHAVGLRNLAAAGSRGTARPKAAKAGKPAFKQYRDKDGLFYFKLLDEHGSQLLQSLGFASPQEAGRAIGTLREQRGAALSLLAAQLQPIDNANMRAATDALEALAADAAGDTSD
jgi:tryptophanyl-tRNA synthetase